MMRPEARFDVSGQLTAPRLYAQSRIRHDIDAKDLVHDALVCTTKTRDLSRRREFKAQLLPILHNVYADSSRARYAEVQRLAGAGELVEPQLPAGRTIMYAYANFDRRSSTYRKSSARLCISLRLRALTYVEAAAAVGVPAGTLMSRIARPRGRAESYRR